MPRGTHGPYARADTVRTESRRRPRTEGAQGARLSTRKGEKRPGAWEERVTTRNTVRTRGTGSESPTAPCLTKKSAARTGVRVGAGGTGQPARARGWDLPAGPPLPPPPPMNRPRPGHPQGLRKTLKDEVGGPQRAPGSRSQAKTEERPGWREQGP